ncbi:MAG: monovalent cation/H(+) antiporter subunit G [Chlamydiia bacterium]|nr:monovalent cation/H(+) antiporter subunit G [Chlamydiia bacterium]
MSVAIEAGMILLGAFFILTAGVGLVRLPGALCRAHALSKAATLGLSLLLLPLYGVIGTLAAGIKVSCVIVFHVMTLPLAGHIFASYASGEKEGAHQ